MPAPESDTPIPTKTDGWQCDQGDGTFDHDWQVVSDWGGDAGVIGGTFDCSFRRCRACGAEDHETPIEPPEPLPDDVI